MLIYDNVMDQNQLIVWIIFFLDKYHLLLLSNESTERIIN